MGFDSHFIILSSFCIRLGIAFLFFCPVVYADSHGFELGRCGFLVEFFGELVNSWLEVLAILGHPNHGV